LSAVAPPSPEPGDYRFANEDRPTFPGSPFAPPHPGLRRVGYGLIGLWIGATVTFANALVTVNVSNLAGAYGDYVAELTWLPAVYVAINACGNLLLVKARAQYGVPRVMRPLFVIYALVAALQLVAPTFASAILVRGICGLVSAGLVTLAIYYLLQVVPPRMRPVPLVVVLGLVQFGTPLARLMPVDLLAANHWHGLHGVELAMVLTTFALTTWLPLPPSERIRQFEPLDFVTIALVAPGMVLVCGVVNRGRLAWWTDTPWLGYALAAAIPLLVAAGTIELLRSRPLLNLRWLARLDIVRFIVVALLMRLALAEQTYGAVGLLTSGNLDNDQLRTLFGFVLLGMSLGIVTCVLSLSEERLPYQVLVAALAIALGAWLDSHASNVTRPEQLYWSQSLIGFGTCLFIGPTLAYGIIRVIKQGPAYLVSLVVVFSITQNVGGLVGSAALGTYQVIATHEHALILGERITGADPQVGDRVRAGATAVAGVVTDPRQRAIEGGSSLGSSVGREAAILAFNDVFRLVAFLALATAVYLTYLVSRRAVRTPESLEVP
jgi:hypothetical protein